MIIKFEITFDTQSGKYQSEAKRVDQQEESVNLTNLSDQIYNLFITLSKTYANKVLKNKSLPSKKGQKSN